MDSETFSAGVALLCRDDARLAGVVERHGPPPFWVRRPGWQTLVRIILEQQVSLASGRAVYRRLEKGLHPISARRLAGSSIETLRSFGLTRQKAGYCRELASAVAGGQLRLSRLARMDDTAARETLCRQKGIGPWTADCYLLMALRRPDVWPSGDLALIRAIDDIYPGRLAAKPDRLAERWKPWRAVAARLLWHDYLSRRSRTI